MSDHAISRFPVPALEDLPADIREMIETVQGKSGFVPNVFLALAHRPDEFRAFFAAHDALMDKSDGLSKAEREMIVVATSATNGCLYCVVAHGAILRIRAKNPLISDQLAINPAKADLSDREQYIVEFALKVAHDSATVSDAHLDVMRENGFTDDEMTTLSTHLSVMRFEEAEKIAAVMQVPVMVGTVCFGSPYVGAGCVASDSHAFVGSGSTGPELNRIEDALGLI